MKPNSNASKRPSTPSPGRWLPQPRRRAPPDDVPISVSPADFKDELPILTARWEDEIGGNHGPAIPAPLVFGPIAEHFPVSGGATF